MTKVKKNYCGFLRHSWCNKKVNPETYVPCGSYELLLSNVAHQMKEKATNFKFQSILTLKMGKLILNC